jgi:O-succinylbenzoic acid--CoA ligase
VCVGAGDPDVQELRDVPDPHLQDDSVGPVLANDLLGKLPQHLDGELSVVGGERVHAVIFGERLAINEAELGAFCRERLADYKVPEGFTVLDQPLPRNSNGKILKRALREMLFPGA